MSEHRHIPEPGELVYTPRPSWAPAFLALGAAGLVCGIFAAGFIFPRLDLRDRRRDLLSRPPSATSSAARSATYFRLPRRAAASAVGVARRSRRSTSPTFLTS